MRVAVSGSIALDYLMTFPQRFRDVIVPERMSRLSLSFLVDGLDIRRGGVAANICFGMAALGQRPVLVGAVGRDFLNEYGPWLEGHGVDLAGVQVSETRNTSLFLCTTDVEENQLATFYAGAMQEARDIDIAQLAERQPIDVLVVSPNDPEAMLRHTDQARHAGIPFVADPSQQLARLDGDTVRALVDGASYLLSNDYEAALIESKTGWSAGEILERVGVRVTTHGADGCVIEREGQPAIKVPAVPVGPSGVADPTGVGDAFRAGFITGCVRGLDLETSAQLGATLATCVLETVGTQEYEPSRDKILKRLETAYGHDAAALEQALG